MATEQYITIYTGDQIDEAIGAYLENKECGRTLITVSVASEAWQDSDPGSGHKYEISITYGGAYNVGNYPIVFFVDTANKRKYEVDCDGYQYNAATQQSSITVYSNVQIAGDIVIVSSKTPIAL